MNRKKSNNKRGLCTSAILAVIIVFSAFTVGIEPVSAQTSVTRDLPVYVQPGEEFEVTLTQNGFDYGMGTVVETLPVGFEYIDGSYTGGGANKEETVTYDGGTRKLRATQAFVDEEDNATDSVTYRVTASLTEQNAVFVGEYAAWTGAGVETGNVTKDTEVGVDGTPPETSNHVPAKGAGGVSVDTNIVVDVTDDNAVDPTTITMEIDSDAIPMILGESLFFVSMSHYTINYDPADDFDYSTVYPVTIDASDAAGNAMTPDTYVFQTEFPDTTPPAQITNLATSNPTSSSIDLTWTAPGDDGNTGTANEYDIRYLAGTTPITDANWASAIECTGEPAPQVAGSSEAFTVTGLAADTGYYFAIKTADGVPNWSTISNSPSGTTLVSPDTTSPAAITDLAAGNPTSSTIDLTWTAPGDDGNTGTATTYDIRYLAGTTPITDANWASATECTGEPAPQVAGSSETFTVTGLAADTTYYFAIKTADEVPNWSPISNSPSGTTLVSPDTTSPAAITNLATSNLTSSSIDLTWTAPGDDDNTGTAATYDIRYLEGTTLITDANWAAATQCTGEPTPQVAGSSETFTVTGLAADTTYYFAIKTADEVPLWSDISNSPIGSTAVSEVIPLPGFEDPPTDPDGDGLYEDLNGNERLDFNDVVVFFNNLDWIAANEPTPCFDFNGNERIDFNDVVTLFEMF